jgi:hypothetical protein
MDGVLEVSKGISLVASPEVQNHLAAIDSVRRTGYLFDLFETVDWKGEYSFTALESVNYLRIWGAGFRVTKIDFPRLVSIETFELLSNRSAMPTFPELRSISRRFTIGGSSDLSALPPMPKLESAPTVEIGQGDELVSIDELNDVRADVLRVGSNPKLTSCRIDRTVAAMRQVNPQLRVTRDNESTLPCQE